MLLLQYPITTLHHSESGLGVGNTPCLYQHIWCLSVAWRNTQVLFLYINTCLLNDTPPTAPPYYTADIQKINLHICSPEPPWLACRTLMISYTWPGNTEYIWYMVWKYNWRAEASQPSRSIIAIFLYVCLYIYIYGTDIRNVLHLVLSDCDFLNDTDHRSTPTCTGLGYICTGENLVELLWMPTGVWIQQS